MAWDLWQFRNRIVHNGEQGLLELQIKQEVEAEFEHSLADYPPHVRHHFRPGIIEVLQRPLHVQSSWLVCIFSGREKQERLAKQGRLEVRQKRAATRQLQETIAAWMQTLPRTQNERVLHPSVVGLTPEEMKKRQRASRKKKAPSGKTKALMAAWLTKDPTTKKATSVE